MKRIVLSIVLLALVAISPWVETHAGGGEEGAVFLRIDPSPQSTALGGASTTLGGTPYGTYSNPATLIKIKERYNVAFMHAQWIAGIHHTFIGATWKVTKDLVLGAAGSGVYTIDLIKTPDDYNRAYQSCDRFSTLDICLGLSLSGRLTSRLSLGGTLKGIHQRIDGKRWRGVACDIGVVYGTTKWATGLVVRHLGPKIPLPSSSTSFPLPLDAVCGGRVEPSKGILLLADVKWTMGRGFSLHGGCEVSYQKVLKVRFGYQYLLESGERDALCGPTAGFGIRLPGGGILIDLSYVPYQALGDTLRVSVGYSI